MRTVQIAFVLLLTTFLGCDLAGENRSSRAVEIAFRASGGFGGGVLQNLSVTEGGLATDSTRTPILTLQLHTDEHRSLLSHFSHFFAFDDTYGENGCYDGVLYEITYRPGRRAKTVSVSGCRLHGSEGTELDMLEQIVKTLSDLGRRVYQAKAPWLGLEADFYVENSTYGTGESMRFVYRIVNPTDSPRTLHFPHTARTHFTISRPAFPYWDHHNTYDHGWGPLSSLEIAPGVEETLQRPWDQTYVDDDDQTATLEPGRYRIKLRLLDTGNLRRDEPISVDVVDRSIPLAGYVEGLGMHEADHAFTFRLHVRNWTNEPVTLDFPNRERLFIQLYDRDIPDSGPMIFEGPASPEAAPSSVILQPGGSRALEQTVLKEKLNLTHRSYLARVELMASNLTFIREAMLRISH